MNHKGDFQRVRRISADLRLNCRLLEQVQPKRWEDPAPGPSLAELDQVWWPLQDRMAACAEDCEGGADLAIRWHISADYALPMYKVVLHVVNHATYHRGQIAAMLRQSGHVPRSTDLSYYQLGL